MLLYEKWTFNHYRRLMNFATQSSFNLQVTCKLLLVSAPKGATAAPIQHFVGCKSYYKKSNVASITALPLFRSCTRRTKKCPGYVAGVVCWHGCWSRTEVTSRYEFCGVQSLRELEGTRAINNSIAVVRSKRTGRGNLGRLAQNADSFAAWDTHKCGKRA